MADFLTRLAERTLGLAPTVQSMLAPMYAPGRHFVGAEDSQQGIRDTWDVINQAPTVGAATEDTQGGVRGQEVSVQDKLPEPSPGDLVEQTVNSPEMLSPLVPQGNRPSTMPTQMHHTIPQSNVQFANDEASYGSQLKVIHRFADSYHTASRTPEVQPALDGLTSLGRNEVESSSGWAPKTENTRNVPVPGLQATHSSDVTSILLESHTVSTSVEQDQDSGLQFRYARGVLESEEASNVSKETGYPQGIPLHVPQGKRPVGASLVSSVADVLPVRRPVEPKAIRPQQDTSQVSSQEHSYSRVNKHKVAPVMAESSTPAPTIQVTIGRIEVRATPLPNPRSQPRHSEPPVMGLEEYLNQRAKGGY